MFNFFRDKRTSKRNSRKRWDLGDTLLKFAKGEPYTIAHSFEGLAIYGGPGSGKTSASGFQLAMSMLRIGFGALVLTAKVDEVLRWKRMCELAGRSNDLIVFDEESGHRFNFLNYMGSRQPAEAGLSSVYVYLIEELIEVIERVSGAAKSRGDEQFWSVGRRRLAQNAIDLALLTTGEVSIPYIVEIMRDAPYSMEELKSPEWQARSVVYQLLTRESNDSLSENAQNDLLEVGRYFWQEYPKLAEKTRSVIEASLSGVLHLFMRGQLRRLFSEGTTVTPDDIVRDGKIVVVNLPIKKFFGIGSIAQTIWKIAFQQRAEQREDGEDRPCLLYMDEAQTLLSKRDADFAATARSSRVCNMWLTQNLSNVYMVTGGDETGKAAADSLMALASTKIFHSNACPVTGQWAADLIGKRRTRMRSTSLAHPKPDYKVFFPERAQVSTSSSESFEYVIAPHEFSMLTKGGMPHRTAEAIVFQSGRRFKSTGEPYCRIHFAQGF